MLWIKTFHIVAVVSWFAGLLYLPRLFVYHAECDDEIGRQRFCVMEKRLFWRIMTPAATAAVALGWRFWALNTAAIGLLSKSSWCWRCWRIMLIAAFCSPVSPPAKTRTALFFYACSMKFRRCYCC